jgi:hypothetical protein
MSNSKIRIDSAIIMSLLSFILHLQPQHSNYHDCSKCCFYPCLISLSMIFISPTCSCILLRTTINICYTLPILSGEVSFGGNTAQFLKSPNCPLYFSRSLSHEAQLQFRGFLTNRESYSFAPSPSRIINI